MLIEGLTDKGITRKNNQDSFYIDQKEGFDIMVVCDGIGGHKGGEVASTSACKVVEEEFKNLTDNPKDWLSLTCKVVNRSIFLQGSKDEQIQGMGTTLVGALRDCDKTYVANIGDSRCYKIKDGQMIQVSVDHSLVNELMNKGYSYEEAISHGKNVITRAMGIEANCDFDIYELENDYDSLMLCSDGLYNYVSSDDILEILTSNDSLKNKVQRLILKANQDGGYDNITVTVMEVRNG